jgi:sortase A
VRRLAALSLIAAGLLLLSGLVGDQISDSRATAEAQERLLGSVPDRPRADVARARPVAAGVGTGEALAVMRVPRFGADWTWAVLEGSGEDVIADGPGHYSGTALPGETGNAAFAGHRAGHGSPFIDFDRLRPGDEVSFSQGGTTWVYVVDTRPEIVPIDSLWLLDPLPGRQLTLTTCWPKYGSSERMYVRGHLDRVETGADGADETVRAASGTS